MTEVVLHTFLVHDAAVRFVPRSEVAYLSPFGLSDAFIAYIYMRHLVLINAPSRISPSSSLFLSFCFVIARPAFFRRSSMCVYARVYVCVCVVGCACVCVCAQDDPRLAASDPVWYSTADATKFDTFLTSMLTLYDVAMVTGWPQIMDACTHVTGMHR